MPYVRLFHDSMPPGKTLGQTVDTLLREVRSIAYALNSMEGIGCRVVKQQVGRDTSRITIVADGSGDTPFPTGGEPVWYSGGATAYPVWPDSEEGITYVLARKALPGGEIGWFPVTTSCPPPDSQA